MLFSKRKAQLDIATGTQGVGKSFTTYHKELVPYSLGNPSIGQPPRRVLIHDVNDEYGEFGVKSINMSHIPHFVVHPTIEIRRVRPYKVTPGGTNTPMIGIKLGTKEILNQLEEILAIYGGGLLLCEDINKYVTDSMPGDLVGNICTLRHSSCDVMLHYQSAARPLPKIWQNLTGSARFHYQEDDVDHSKGKLQEKTERMKIIQTLVNKRYLTDHDERFYVHMNNRKKIIGNFTYEEFMWALEEYILTHPVVLKRYTDRLDKSGRKAYNFETALNSHKEQLFTAYWGNNESILPIAPVQPVRKP